MNQLDINKFKEIINSDDFNVGYDVKHCKILTGLNIISKYIPNGIFGGAEHDIIYLCSVDTLIGANISTEDVELLSGLNFGFDEDNECLYTFV